MWRVQTVNVHGEGGGGGGSSDGYTRKYTYPATKQHRLRKLILVKEVKEGPNGHPLNSNKLRWGGSPKLSLDSYSFTETQPLSFIACTMQPHLRPTSQVEL